MTYNVFGGTLNPTLLLEHSNVLKISLEQRVFRLFAMFGRNGLGISNKKKHSSQS